MGRCLILLLGLITLACGSAQRPGDTAPPSTVLPTDDLALDSSATDAAPISVSPPDLTAPADVSPAVADVDSADLSTSAAGDLSLDADTGDSVSAPFPHFDKVVDLHRGTARVWATLITVGGNAGTPTFTRVDYKDTGTRHDFWPASTIKLYAATAALILLNDLSLSLDAKVTFSRYTDGSWVEDTTRTVRSLIRGALPCSSNEDYTLLLRLVGVDWINQTLFTPANGFEKTALMQGYVSARPYGYRLEEPQRLVISDGQTSHTRKHSWSGVSYANLAGCTVANGSGRANCSTPNDLAEQMRRIVFHDLLPPAERLAIRSDDAAWLRSGDSEGAILGSQCTGGGWPGVARVLPQASYLHKTGSISDTKLDVAYVASADEKTRFILALATETTSTTPRERLFEAVTRMVVTPSLYVYLAPLVDQVNPIRATLTVYSGISGSLQLITKPTDQDGLSLQNWSPLDETLTTVPAGWSDQTLVGPCETSSRTLHVRGALSGGGVTAYSDLHYVIIDQTQPCP